jgi:glycosyltransferase involved in cell wall biosynthesis
MHRPVDVCIITQMHVSLNPRVVKEADALSEAGYQVAVISPDYSVWGREADKEFDGRPWKIVERPQFGPQAPPATRLAELTRRAIAGVAVNLGIEHPAVLHAARNPVAPALIDAAKRQPASLYIGHLAGLPAAAIAALHHRAKYAYDAEDFHPGDLPETPENSLTNRMVRQIEAQYLPGCAYMTAASPGIADAYAAEYGIHSPTVILNTFPKSRAPNQCTPSGSIRPSPSIYWFSQTIGPGRGIECAIKAVAISKARPHLYLRGTLATVYRNCLQELAESNGVLNRIHFLAPEPPHRMEFFAAQFDVGFSGETSFSPNNSIALGNKLFTYLLAGIPMLLSDSLAHRRFAPELGDAAVIFATDNAVDLSQAIDRLLLDEPALERARRAAWQLGQTRYNWQIDAKRLVEVVQGVIKPSQ